MEYNLGWKKWHWLFIWFDKKIITWLCSFDFPVNRVKIKILFFKLCLPQIKTKFWSSFFYFFANFIPFFNLPILSNNLYACQQILASEASCQTPRKMNEKRDPCFDNWSWLLFRPKIIKVFHIETIRKFKGEYTFQKGEFPES